MSISMHNLANLPLSVLAILASMLMSFPILFPMRECASRSQNSRESPSNLIQIAVVKGFTSKALKYGHQLHIEIRDLLINQGPLVKILRWSFKFLNLTAKKSQPRSRIAISPTGFHI